MSAAAAAAARRCVFSHLLRHSVSPGQHELTVLSSQLSTKPLQTPGSSDGEEVPTQPVKFSTSKASHKTWKVERSMGSRLQRPWWQVLPLSILTVGFLLWCVFRKESDIDRTLEKRLYEHLPGLLSNIDETEDDEETEENEELKKTP
ncbi:protein CCSMST1 isoform X2 [Tachysurus fulvidraco]|uniref:protein CCSMST1 isoform X2 n=1 Tax=Tachysurus fulvidraco TaxID=1234273 RepID=UPI001FEFDA34|nr:protein CCSMST1 isoform X2 [Tachysurus fulvidraco]